MSENGKGCCGGSDKTAGGCCGNKCDPRTVVTILSLLIAAAALFYAFTGGDRVGAVKPEPGKVLATLNGKKITEGDVKSMILDQIPGAQADQLDKAMPQLLEQYINMALIDTEAQKSPAAKSDEVKKQIAMAKKQIVRAAFLREKADLQVTDATVAAAYKEAFPNGKMKEFKARHILVADEATAAKLLADLEKGADFGKLAKENSVDKGSAERGGDLGFFPPRAMVKPFADAVSSNGVGLIKTPVKTNFGYHIIDVQETRERAAPSEKEASPVLRQELVQKQVDDLIAALRAKAKIELVEAKADAAPAPEAEKAPEAPAAEVPAAPAPEAAPAPAPAPAQ